MTESSDESEIDDLITPRESRGLAGGKLRAEVRTLAGMAWQVIVLRLCSNGASFIATATVGQLGSDELAASAYAWAVMNLSTSLYIDGVGSAMSTLTAQAVGARNGELAGLWLQTTLCACAAMAPAVALLWASIGAILGAMPGVDGRVARLAGVYGRLSICWLLPETCAQLLERWFVARQIVRPLLAVNVAYLCLTALANVALVHGLPFLPWGLGFDGLGFEGAPLATGLCACARALGVWGYACAWRKLHRGAWGGFDARGALARERVRAFARQALPAAVAPALEQAQFVLVTTWCGRLGTDALAAHAAMLDLFMFATAGMYGFCDSCAARVGAALGAGRPRAARTTFRATLLSMVAMGAFVGALFVATRAEVGYLFSSDESVRRHARSMATLTGGFYVMLCLLYSSIGALEGQGRQGMIAGVMLVGSWGVATPLCFALAFPGGYGLLGIWWGFVGGYGSISLLLLLIVYLSDWPKLATKARQRAEVATAASRPPRDDGDGAHVPVAPKPPDAAAGPAAQAGSLNEPLLVAPHAQEDGAPCADQESA